MIQLRGFGTRHEGQSLVEIALAFPLLLIALLGMVDVGRAYIYTTAVTNAAREAAYYAAKTQNATLANVAQRACNETGFEAYSATFAGTVSGSTATCASGLVVTSGTCPTASGDVLVDVSYTFSPISGYLFKNLIGRDTLVARSSACFRSLQ